MQINKLLAPIRRIIMAIPEPVADKINGGVALAAGVVMSVIGMDQLGIIEPPLRIQGSIGEIFNLYRMVVGQDAIDFLTSHPSISGAAHCALGLSGVYTGIRVSKFADPDEDPPLPPPES